MGIIRNTRRRSLILTIANSTRSHSIFRSIAPPPTSRTVIVIPFRAIFIIIIIIIIITKTMTTTQSFMDTVISLSTDPLRRSSFPFPPASPPFL